MKNFFFLIIFLFQCELQAQSAVEYGSNSSAGHYVKVNDITLYYEEYGKGHPLLLMHGNGGSIAAFSKLIPLLSKKYRIIAIDSRAQGRSEDSDKDLTFEQMASDVNELLKSLHLDSVYAFGWSDGGIIGLQIAYSFPGKISRLAVSGANFRADSTALAYEFFDTTKIIWFNNLPDTEKERVRKHSRFPKRAGSIYNKLILLDLNYPNFTEEQLNKITVPTLVIAGDHDIIKLSHTVELFHSLPHSQLFIVPNCSHSVPIECAELLSRELIRFFASPNIHTH